MADELCAKFAQAHWVKFEGKVFCEAPVTTRGVPHNLTPGIYKCLDDYLDALETLASMPGARCAHGRLVYVPVLQPVVVGSQIEATADLSMRLSSATPAC